MTIHLPSGRLLAALVLSLTAGEALAANPPSPAQALRIKPVQKDVEYDTPAAADIEKCTIKPEKIAGKSGWVVKNAAGQTLRSFADLNGDNTVDQWSFFKDGVETYRDIDTNHNGTADQCRWLNTAGTRWGIDKNEDKVIDTWQVISPEEVSAEVVAALRDSDAQRFDRLILTAAELSNLGFGDAKREELQKRIAAAPAAFVEYRKNQKIVGPTTNWAYFGGSRPSLIPTGSDDSTADITVYDNVAALTESDGKSGQVPIGTMVKVGDVWRLVDGPGDSADRVLASGGVAPAAKGEDSPGGPSAKDRELMDEYEKLDKKADKSAADNERRVEIVEALAADSKSAEDRIQWLRQAADIINEAVPRNKFPGGIERLTAMRDKATADGQEELAAYLQFRIMTANYNKAMMTNSGDPTQIQRQWLVDLEQFVKDYPKSPDAAEAMLQLGIAQEFAGDDSNAVKWYTRVVQNFPKSPSAVKCEGAKRRIESVGNVLALKGKTLGGKTFDLKELKGRVVLIHYWQSDIDVCRNDMAQLERMMKKYGDQFVVIGVSLDTDNKALTEYLRENGFFWPQLWEQGGLDGR
ncbi:MAG TPA: redoxin domain-containing protein, partial [Pirellulales bacterium]|nr:redoxin domain-containing protein [Pirellulales bacterium]